MNRANRAEQIPGCAFLAAIQPSLNACLPPNPLPGAVKNKRARMEGQRGGGGRRGRD